MFILKNRRASTLWTRFPKAVAFSASLRCCVDMTDGCENHNQAPEKSVVKGGALAKLQIFHTQWCRPHHRPGLPAPVIGPWLCLEQRGIFSDARIPRILRPCWDTCGMSEWAWTLKPSQSRVNYFASLGLYFDTRQVGTITSCKKISKATQRAWHIA